MEDENAFMNYVKAFALPLPLPVYLCFLGIPVIRKKCAFLTILFAVNDVKWKLNLLLYQLRQDQIWNVIGEQLSPSLL